MCMEFQLQLNESTEMKYVCFCVAICSGLFAENTQHLVVGTFSGCASNDSNLIFLNRVSEIMFEKIRMLNNPSLGLQYIIENYCCFIDLWILSQMVSIKSVLILNPLHKHMGDKSFLKSDPRICISESSEATGNTVNSYIQSTFPILLDSQLNAYWTTEDTKTCFYLTNCHC